MTRISVLTELLETLDGDERVATRHRLDAVRAKPSSPASH
jgi:hypothetical protein